MTEDTHFVISVTDLVRDVGCARFLIFFFLMADRWICVGFDCCGVMTERILDNKSQASEERKFSNANFKNNRQCIVQCNGWWDPR